MASATTAAAMAVWMRGQIAERGGAAAKRRPSVEIENHSSMQVCGAALQKPAGFLATRRHVAARLSRPVSRQLLPSIRCQPTGAH